MAERLTAPSQADFNPWIASCEVRLELFHTFYDALVFQREPLDSLAPEDSRFDPIRELFMARAQEIITPHDFEIACRRAIEHGVPPPTREAFYREAALRLFIKDFGVAKTFAQGGVVIVTYEKDKDGGLKPEEQKVGIERLIREEQAKLRQDAIAMMRDAVKPFGASPLTNSHFFPKL